MRRLLTVVSLLLIGSTVPARAQSTTDRALWIWSPPSAVALDFASANGIDRVYQYVGTGTAAGFGGFVAEAHARGLEVYALNGDASWAANPSVVEAWVEEIAASRLFDGVIVDIEPYVHPDWSNRKRRKKLLDNFVKGLDRGRAAAGRIPFVATVPFWFDSKKLRVKKRQLIDRVLDVVDGVNVLAYRDSAAGSDGIIAHAMAEVSQATSAGRTAVISVQTAADELNKLTFFEEGEAAMEAELAQVAAAFEGYRGFAGLAIHHHDSYISLR